MHMCYVTVHSLSFSLFLYVIHPSCFSLCFNLSSHIILLIFLFWFLVSCCRNFWEVCKCIHKGCWEYESWAWLYWRCSRCGQYFAYLKLLQSFADCSAIALWLLLSYAIGLGCRTSHTWNNAQHFYIKCNNMQTSILKQIKLQLLQRKGN